MTIETLAPEVPVEVTSPMKPSEALRIGSATTKQAFGVYYTKDGAMCAAQTIAHVMGHKTVGFLMSINSPTVDSHCPAYGEPGIVTVFGRCDVQKPFYQINHLNDYHRWPRHKIADWLESIGL